MATLQLLFNIFTITGAASLAVFCYQLRRANQQLSSELEQRPAPEPASAAQTPPTLQQPSEHRDIREFVAHRSQEWSFAKPRQA
jgi:hypothetical protein